MKPDKSVQLAAFREILILSTGGQQGEVVELDNEQNKQLEDDGDAPHAKQRLYCYSLPGGGLGFGCLLFPAVLRFLVLQVTNTTSIEKANAQRISKEGGRDVRTRSMKSNSLRPS